MHIILHILHICCHIIWHIVHIEKLCIFDILLTLHAIICQHIILHIEHIDILRNMRHIILHIILHIISHILHIGETAYFAYIAYFCTYSAYLFTYYFAYWFAYSFAYWFAYFAYYVICILYILYILLHFVNERCHFGIYIKKVALTHGVSKFIVTIACSPMWGPSC